MAPKCAQCKSKGSTRHVSNLEDAQRDAVLQKWTSLCSTSAICDLCIRTALPSKLFMSMQTTPPPKARAEKKQVTADKKREPQPWDTAQVKAYQKVCIHARRTRREGTRSGSDVTIPVEQNKKEEYKPNPKEFTDDMVFALLQKGYTLEVIDVLRPVLRKHTNVGGYVCSTHQAEDYVQPAVMEQLKRTAMGQIASPRAQNGLKTLVQASQMV